MFECSEMKPSCNFKRFSLVSKLSQFSLVRGNDRNEPGWVLANALTQLGQPLTLSVQSVIRSGQRHCPSIILGGYQ